MIVRIAVIGLFALSAAAIAPAQDSATTVAGWNLADVGHKPGDDGDRLVSIEKKTAIVDLIYRPSETNHGGSIQAEFAAAKDCKGLSYGSGFDFPDDPAGRAAQVRAEVHEAFGDFARQCPGNAGGEAEVMAGFDQAFAAIDKLMIEHPNVYPPEPKDGEGNSQ